MENHNVFMNVFVYKTGTGRIGIVRADDLAEAADRVADMTRECVTFIVRAYNIENSDYGVVTFDNMLSNVK